VRSTMEAGVLPCPKPNLATPTTTSGVLPKLRRFDPPDENPPSSDLITDDRASTYTFRYPSMYHQSDSEQSVNLDEEPLDHLSTSRSPSLTPTGGPEMTRREEEELVRGSHRSRSSFQAGQHTLAIPETPRPSDRARMITGDEIQAMRKMSPEFG